MYYFLFIFLFITQLFGRSEEKFNLSIIKKLSQLSPEKKKKIIALINKEKKIRKNRRGKKKLFLRTNNKKIKKNTEAKEKKSLDKRSISMVEEDKQEVAVNALQENKITADFLNIILENLTQYAHIYKYIFFTMMNSLSFRHDIKTFSKEKEIKELLYKNADYLIEVIFKKCNNFNHFDPLFLEKNIVFFESDKEKFERVTPCIIKVSKNLYENIDLFNYQSLDEEESESANLQAQRNLFQLVSIDEASENTMKVFFLDPLKVKNEETSFLEKLFNPIKKNDSASAFIFEYIRFLLLAYEYKIGLEEGIVSEKDFFKKVVENTQEKIEAEKNVLYVKKALNEIPRILDELFAFSLQKNEDEETAKPFSQTLRVKIMEIEGDVQKQEKLSYLKIGLGTAALAGSLLFLRSNYQPIAHFARAQLLQASTYFPRVSNLFLNVKGAIQNSLTHWYFNKPLKSKLYDFATFGIGDRLLQGAHLFVNKGIEKIGEKSESTKVTAGASFVLGMGVDYYFDSWFTSYFVSLFGSRASTYFNFSLFNEAKNKILGFLYKLKIYYPFALSANASIDATMNLCAVYDIAEYLKGVLISVLNEKKAGTSRFIGTFKAWVLDRFL